MTLSIRRLTPKALTRLSFFIFLLALLSWFILKLFGPQLIHAAYEGRSISLLNYFITGQDTHSVDDYLSAFQELIDAGMLIAIGLVIVLNITGLGSRLGLHRRSITAVNLLVFLLLCILVLVREPMLVIQPRFWAEEATVFLMTAMNSPFWEALIAPHQGYYSMLANLAGIMATLPKLEYAPAVTTGVALAVQVTILAAVMINNSSLVDTSLKKAVAGTAVVLVGATGEIWLTSICSQHYLVLLMFLILIDEKERMVKRRAYYMIAGVTALSSVASCFLTPLFLLRYWMRQQKPDLVLFVIVSIASGIQLSAILYSHLVLGDAAYAHSSQIRLSPDADWFVALRNILFYVLIYPFGRFSDDLFSGAAAITLSGLMVYALSSKLNTYWAPIAAAWILTILSVIASLKMVGGERYAYASSVIVCIFLIGLAGDKERSKILRLVAGILLARALVFWALHYNIGMDDHYEPEWPVWSDEVSAWREDPTRELKVHPQLESQRKRGIEWSLKIDSSWTE